MPPDARTRHAIKTGRKLAADAVAHRDAQRKRRLATVKRLLKTGAAATAPSAATAFWGGTPAGVLVAEGDSWFDYPLHDVLSELEDEHGFDVESVAQKGDRVEDMAYSGGQLVEFTRRIDKLLGQGKVPRAILLSGGGNDIAGDEFGMLINHVASPMPGVNAQVAAGVIDERIQMAYITILSAVTQICVQRIGKLIPIVLHGYDYPVPDGRGFGGGWGPLPGPWLEPGFRQKGFDKVPRRILEMKNLIDRFNAMVARVTTLSGFGHARYVDLRGTLGTGADYEKWWANELHPTSKGFTAVASRFAAAIP